jgi:hypothetical protein
LEGVLQSLSRGAAVGDDEPVIGFDERIAHRSGPIADERVDLGSAMRPAPGIGRSPPEVVGRSISSSLIIA